MEIEESHDDPLPIAAKRHSNWDNSTWQIRRSGNNGWSIFRGGGWTPVIAADLTPCVSVYENEANSIIQNLDLSPLPADDIVHVQFDLGASEVAAYVVRETNGKRINYKNLGRLSSGKVAFDVDVSELASGIYVLTIALSNGAHLERKIVVH
jgi:Secretion system C-terminal sorting domain